MRNLREKFNKRDRRLEAIMNQEVKRFAEQSLDTNLDAIVLKLNDAETTLTAKEVELLFGGKDGKIDLDAIENQLRFNSVIAYVCGSEVGKNTVRIDAGKTITCADDLLKVFKPCTKKNNGTGVRYVTEDGQSPVFQEGVNVIEVTTGMGATNTLYKISYHEKNRFEEILSKIDLTAITDEDIAMIKKDLDIIGRAMQEIAIDSAKDKTKGEGWGKIENLINQIKMLVNVPVSHNFEDLKRMKYRSEVDGIGDIADYAMKFDAALPVGAYTKEEFAALSLEEQTKAEESEIVCGQLGLARKAILEGTNNEINALVNTYRATSSKEYGEYARYGAINRQLTVFLKRAFDVVAHSVKVDRKISDDAIAEIRCGLYNEMATNELLASPYGKGAMIKYAIAAGMLKLTEEKDGSFSTSYNQASFRFGTVTRIFKDEFVCEYKNAHDVFNAVNFLDVALTVNKKSTAKLVEGAGYKMISGVATMVSVGKNIEKVDGILETRETFTGLAVCRDGKLYAKHDVNKVSNKEVGVCIVKDWFNLETGKELDSDTLTDEKALESHVDILLNAEKVYITGKDKNLIGAEYKGKFYPVCRLHFTPGLVDFPADNSVKAKLIDIKDAFGYISPADEDKNFSAQISGMFTYVAK